MKTKTKKPYTFQRFTISHHSEEFSCHQCGWPVDVGDKAIEVKCNERESNFVICSQACNERDLKDWRSLEDNWQSYL
jgi:hypothetical protein|tara:strand:- start:592 stop:822 length:231 start_codon:yes stop_codon:yes gene_type:complete